MKPVTSLDKAAALVLVPMVILTACIEWHVPGLAAMQAAVAVLVVLLFAPGTRWSRKAFVALGLVLTVWLIAVEPEWQAVVLRGTGSAAFIGALFSALATLRSVAESSPTIRRSGRYLASQPPGRRYAALSLGGHLFALLLGYGSISLLGSLATTAAETEPDPVIRGHRRRRMLLAIQRGFISTLPWSPLSFTLAISIVQVPGATWKTAFVPGLVCSALLLGIGWALDTIFKPRLSAPAPRRPVEGTWRLLYPLFFLLALLAVLVEGLHVVTDIRIIGIVIVVVPLLSLGWAVAQSGGGAGAKARGFVVKELPAYRGEIVLLMMAAYIGTLGAPLLIPLLDRLGLDLGGLPVWLILTGLIWLIPLLGQVGMNPILAVTLIAPLVPDPSVLGIAPSALVTALAAGWALSGISSPFTATTLLVGSFGKVSARDVGLRWNGGYLLVMGLAFCAWTLIYAFVVAG